MDVEKIAASLSEAQRYHVKYGCVFDGLARIDPNIDHLRNLGVADVIDFSSGRFMSRLTPLASQSAPIWRTPTMTETVNVTQADRQARQEWRKNGYTCEGAWLLLDQAFAKHRIEATRQAEADKAELVEAVNRLLMRSQNFMTGALRVSGLSEFREVRALLEKHGGKHDQ